MKKTVTILCLLSVLFANKSSAQITDRQEIGLFVSNVLWGGVTTGIGAVINKDKKQKTLPVFWKGMKVGFGGGALIFAGKKCSNLIYRNENSAAPGAWTAKLVHCAGTSIMENAALHRPLFSHYNLYVGFARLEFDWKGRFSFSPKIMPLSLAGLVYSGLAYNGTFDLSRSLQLGNPYFRVKDSTNFLGIAIKSNVSIAYGPQYTKQDYSAVTAHENGHVLQGYEYYIFNTYFQKPYRKMRSNNKFLKSVDKFVFFDQPIYDGLSLLMYNVAISQLGCYWKNPFEFEAERMATGKHFYLSEYCK